MLFIKIGKIAAHLLFWSSIARYLLAFVLALQTDSMEANRAAAQRYLAASSTGEAINEAVLYAILGLALGILAEIGKRVIWLEESTRVADLEETE